MKYLVIALAIFLSGFGMATCAQNNYKDSTQSIIILILAVVCTIAGFIKMTQDDGY